MSSASARFALLCRDPKVQTLTVRVFDYDFGAEDDFLGSSVADVQPLCDGRQHDLELQLRGSPFAAVGGSQEEGAACEEVGQGSGEGMDGSRSSGQASSGEEADAASSAAGDGAATSEVSHSASDGSGSVQLSARFLPFSQLLADEVAEPDVDGQPVLATPGEVRATGCCCPHGNLPARVWLHIHDVQQVQQVPAVS